MHELIWLSRRSFSWRAGCTCGWEGLMHWLLEREARAEHESHVAICARDSQ